MKKIKLTKNDFTEEIDYNEFMRKKHKKDFTNLNDIEHFFILASAVTNCIWVSPSAFLLVLPIETAIWLR